MLLHETLHELNSKATFTSGFAKATISKIEKHLPKKQVMVVIVSAMPALPCLAIGPKQTTATDLVGQD